MGDRKRKRIVVRWKGMCVKERCEKWENMENDAILQIRENKDRGKSLKERKREVKKIKERQRSENMKNRRRN